MFESRACNPNFEPATYASAYPDLRESFGLDVLQYYKHYVTVGAKENRTITTLEACGKILKKRGLVL